MGEAETQRAIAAAERAFALWKQQTAEARARLLQRWFELMMENQEDLARSEEHTSELQSPCNLVCRLLLEKKKTTAAPDCQTETVDYEPAGAFFALLCYSLP